MVAVMWYFENTRQTGCPPGTLPPLLLASAIFFSAFVLCLSRLISPSVSHRRLMLSLVYSPFLQHNSPHSSYLFLLPRSLFSTSVSPFHPCLFSYPSHTVTVLSLHCTSLHPSTPSYFLSLPLCFCLYNCHVKHEGLYCLLKIDLAPEGSYMIPLSMDTHTCRYKLSQREGSIRLKEI